MLPLVAVAVAFLRTRWTFAAFARLLLLTVFRVALLALADFCANLPRYRLFGHNDWIRAV